MKIKIRERVTLENILDKFIQRKVWLEKLIEENKRLGGTVHLTIPHEVIL